MFMIQNLNYFKYGLFSSIMPVKPDSPEYVARTLSEFLNCTEFVDDSGVRKNKQNIAATLRGAEVGFPFGPVECKIVVIQEGGSYKYRLEMKLDNASESVEGDIELRRLDNGRISNNYYELFLAQNLRLMIKAFYTRVKQ